MKDYNFEKIENNWRDSWYRDNLYEAVDFSPKPKKYILAEFPYPSGVALHAGHMMRYTVPDVYARFLRMKGYNVLFPMGWDAFGLPAESYAVKTGVHPAITTKNSIDSMRSSLKRMGYGFDWSREISTIDPHYYKWTQWLFLKFWEHGLAELREMPVWWCEKLKTVLAEEEVLTDKNGNKISERGEHPVERRMLKQWVLKIPEYAQKLIDGLKDLDFPDAIKHAQINWIGKSEGAEIDFKVVDSEEKIRIFTTRLDTIFGVTFLVVSPENPVLAKIVTPDQKAAVETYQAQAAQKNEMERVETTKDKSGVFTGAYAINPYNNEKLPIWTGDFVVMSYGTGAIMSVPAHDARDFDFAQKYNLPIKYVIKSEPASYLVVEKSLPAEEIVKLAEFGTVAVQSVDAAWGKFFRVSVPLKKEVDFIEFLKAKLLVENPDGGGWYADSFGSTNTVVFKTQHFVITSKEACAEAKRYGMAHHIPEEQVNFILKPNCDKGDLINSGQYTGLASELAVNQMVKVAEQNGFGVKKVNFKMRDWIFSRQRYWGEPLPLVYVSPDNHIEPVCTTTNIAEVSKLLPVVLPEVPDYEPTSDAVSPLAKNKDWMTTKTSDGRDAVREANTMPNWAGSCWYFIRYVDPHNDSEFASADKLKYWMPVDKYFGGAEHTTMHLLYSRFWYKFFYDIGIVPTPEPYKWRLNGGLLLGPDGRKMSKSIGNTVDPMTILENYGADALKMFICFIGPYEDTYPWNENGIKSCWRLAKTIYELQEKVSADALLTKELDIAYNKMVMNITDMVDKLKMNTAISELMIFVNLLKTETTINKELWTNFVKVLAPFAPYLAEELWFDVNGYKVWDKTKSVHVQSWPGFDAAKTLDSTANIAIQVNGKVKGTVCVPANADEQTVKAAALEIQKVKEALEGKSISKTIFVTGKILSLLAA